MVQHATDIGRGPPVRARDRELRSRKGARSRPDADPFLREDRQHILEHGVLRVGVGCVLRRIENVGRVHPLLNFTQARPVARNLAIRSRHALATEPNFLAQAGLHLEAIRLQPKSLRTGLRQGLSLRRLDIYRVPRWMAGNRTACKTQSRCANTTAPQIRLSGARNLLRGSAYRSAKDAQGGCACAVSAVLGLQALDWTARSIGRILAKS